MSSRVTEIGDLIDNRYRILEPLGQGGMAAVYRAEHIGIKREVAIKVLHGELVSDAAINERVMREAFATARMNHPNCVRVTDSGVSENGESFLVMELLLGQSLGDEIFDRETLPEKEAIHVAREVLKGLEHAHAHGIVHRDLKPHNIFLVPQEGGFPLVKILDFGIVKLQGAAMDALGGGEITQAGMAIGSPYYMSPEQALGSELDERTDLYSLSLVFFEMLMGEPPFCEKGDKLRSLKRRLHEDVPAIVPPKGPKVSKRLQSVIRHGLARRPEDRISTATAYLEKLDALEKGELDSIGESDTVPLMVALEDEATPYIVYTPMPAQGIETRYFLLAAMVALLGLGVFLALSRGDDSTQVAVSTSEEEPEVIAARLEAELTRLTAIVEAGRGKEELSDLQKLHFLLPEDPKTNRLLGLTYLQKRFWRDGFKYLRKAISLDPTLRNDEVLIKAALRALTSRKRPMAGVHFLANEIGDSAIPYLQETIQGGSERQKEFAARALKEIRR